MLTEFEKKMVAEYHQGLWSIRTRALTPDEVLDMEYIIFGTEEEKRGVVSRWIAKCVPKCQEDIEHAQATLDALKQRVEEMETY